MASLQHCQRWTVDAQLMHNLASLKPRVRKFFRLVLQVKGSCRPNIALLRQSARLAVQPDVSLCTYTTLLLLCQG